MKRIAPPRLRPRSRAAMRWWSVSPSTRTFPPRIDRTGYPMDTLGAVAGSRVRAKRKVLLTDSCHSGAIAPDAEAQKLNKSLLDLSSSMFSLTASRDRERSFESKNWGDGHGI